MSLSTARASPAPSEQADETDLRVKVPDGIRKEPVKQTSIPAELLLSLTSTVSKNTQGHTAHHRSCENDGIRRPDGVWHYPLGRTKYKYFLEQPTSLTEAGRDISFLCDAVLTQKKMTALPPLHEKSCNGDIKKLNVKQNVIPEEYRIVKNKGIQCLQLYEDAFTVQLKDQEQKLRVLPSLRPSGRLEVIQLMRMMDDMLEKAGVDQQNEELTDLCQLESLLELVKTEQNIYNIVFHELIRQVTVGCAERGQLLAKLRQRYQSLLERIPQCLKTLHTEVVAQRALDRRLIEQIYHIKASIQQINIELAKVRDHDAFVSDKMEHAQEELAKSSKETLSYSDVVQGYHHLYELHRTRLEEQLEQLTEDRDHWSRFTFNLALKVIKVKKLQLVSELYVSGEGWFETAHDCLVYITTKDTHDMDVIVELTNKWKNQLTTLMLFVKKIHHAQFEQIFSLKEGIKKWHLHIRTQNRNKVPEYDITTMAEIHADLWRWSNKLSVVCEECQGERKAIFQRRLHEVYSTMDKFAKISFRTVERHIFPDVEPAVSLETIRELENVLTELLRQYNTQASEIHQLIASMFNLMDFWASVTHSALQVFSPQSAMTASDWTKLEEAFSNWRNIVEDIFLYFPFAQTDKQTDQRMVKKVPDLYSGTEKALEEVQELANRLFSFTETENKKLLEEVVCLHEGQTNLMMALLLHMLPDQIEEEDKDPKHKDKIKNSAQALVEDAERLSKKLVYYSRFITRSSNLILEQAFIVDPIDAQMENKTEQFKKLQTDGNKWLASLKILLKELTEKFEKKLIMQPKETSSIPQPPESMETETSEGPLQEPRQADKTRDGTEPEQTETSEGPLQEPTQHDETTDGTEPEKTETSEGPLQEPTQHDETTDGTEPEKTETSEGPLQEPTQHDETTDGTEPEKTETSEGPLQEPTQHDETTDGTEPEKTETSEGPLQEPTQHDETTDGTEPEKTEMIEEPETEQQERPSIKLIDYDGNIIQRYQDDSMVQLPGGNELVVCPVIEEAQKAFSDLAALVLLQKELRDSEKLTIIAEKRAREAEEALTEALNKIKDLERLLQRQPAPESPSKDEEKIMPPHSPPTAADPTSET
ncbi:axonemal dynein light chain domain-containing protein 1 isoform X1 [Xiphophorus hellerii]|uniref:axonemal dynein light chain domain-containing protein 1 isoform X1 n=1 Tax=Xiphophorus hellerii TaxID=8084 RepID=UPI0013B3C908|nr:axonemal dynein light chain domain-containing protein 1 isoform X1 [Xiphophorus hellerii]